MVMQDVFDKLRTLQDILSRKYQMEKELQDIPKTLSTKTELLNRLKKSYIEKNTQYEALQEKIRSLRQKMNDAEHQREEYEKQMDLIKTQREYEALDKEIRDAADKEQQLRKDLQREDKSLEEMVHSLEREELMIKQQEEDLISEQESVKRESQDKQDLLQQLQQEENETLPGLEEEIVFKFERIIRSKAGLGIVPIRKNVCTGCHMILPNQFVNDVREGEKILFCPYCSRILFFQTDEEDVLFTDEDSEGLADLEEFEIEDEDYEDEEDADDNDEEYSEDSEREEEE